MIQFIREILKNCRKTLNKLLRSAKNVYFKYKFKTTYGSRAKTWKLFTTLISRVDPISPNKVLAQDSLSSNKPKEI